jgi:hypothetical protein
VEQSSDSGSSFQKTPLKGRERVVELEMIHHQHEDMALKDFAEDGKERDRAIIGWTGEFLFLRNGNN